VLAGVATVTTRETGAVRDRTIASYMKTNTEQIKKKTEYLMKAVFEKQFNWDPSLQLDEIRIGVRSAAFSRGPKPLL